MGHIDYSNLNAEEVVRRLRLLRGNSIIIGPSDVVPILLRYAITLPLYKTSEADPIDAVVEMLCTIIPMTPVVEVQRLARNGDHDAMHSLAVWMMFGMYGITHDCDMVRVMTMQTMTASRIDARNVADCAEHCRTMRCRCQHSPVSERFSGAISLEFTSQEEFNDIMWTFIDRLCASDYASPFTCLMAVEASRWGARCTPTIKKF